jgi:predicted transcriptional regulator
VRKKTGLGKNGKAGKTGPKPGSKKQILLSLISRRNGASLEELMAALDWQKHSVRGFIATLGKTMGIESFKTEQGVRTYKLS